MVVSPSAIVDGLDVGVDRDATELSRMRCGMQEDAEWTVRYLACGLVRSDSTLCEECPPRLQGATHLDTVVASR